MQTRPSPLGPNRRSSRRKVLRQPAVLERQVRRMLADSRSESLVDNFAEQWLYLRNLAMARRGYQHPARFLSYYTWRDPNGKWLRGRAITVSTETAARSRATA